MGPSASPAAARPRRFYKAAAAVAQPPGFAIALDGRVAKTPAGRPLAPPTEALAALIAEEWAAQAEHIDLSTMPATRLAFTVIDRTEGAGEAMAAEVARYAGADVICYVAEAPEALAERQAAGWGPMRDWARDALGVDLRRVTGLIAALQSPEALVRVQALVAEMEPFRRAGVAYATPLFGSAILALALERGALDGDAAFDLSRLDEAFQEERWGADSEAVARTAMLREDSRRLEQWFRALDA